MNATSLPANIFLIGYRGTGKTTVAQLLAERLGWTAVDADAVLEAKAGRTIREIFAEQGETAFRDLETAILADLCQQPKQVIATGGGVILREENRTLLKQSGLCIWLTADAHTIWHRLQQDDSTGDRRPNLTTGGLAEIEELLRQREKWYREGAVVSVDSAGIAPSEVTDAIALQLETMTGLLIQHGMPNQNRGN